MRFSRFNLPLTPSLVRRGKGSNSPLLIKEGPGEVAAGGDVSGIVNTRTTATRRVLPAFLALALAVLPSVVLACPACKDALEGDSVGRALSWTTLLMIAVPMLLFTSIGGWVFFVYWRAARRAAREDAAARSVSWPMWAEKESET